MVRHWWFLSRQSKRLVVVGSVLMLITAAAILATLWEMRRSTMRDAEQSISHLGIAISEQTSRAMQAVDLEIRALQGRVIATGVSTPDQFSALFGTEATHKDLLRHSEELPQASAFIVVDVRGHLVNYSRRWPIPDVDFSDRDYFKHFRDSNDPGLYVSESVTGRTDGRRTAFVARRVNGPDGRFLGVVLGALDLEYFQSFYNLVSSDETSVTLLRNDGVVLTRFPMVEGMPERMPLSSSWYEAVAHGSGSYHSDGALGRSERLISIHALADYPIVVNVGIAKAQVLASWRREATMIALGSLCGIVCVALLLRAIAAQLERLERSEASLVKKNDILRSIQARLRDQAAMLAANQSELADKTTVLETTLENMNQGLLTVTPDGRIAAFNRRLLDMLDLPAAWMATRPTFAELIAFQREGAEFEAADPSLPDYVGTGEMPSTPTRYERMRPDGRTIEVHSIPVQGGGMVRTFTDISERRQSEQKLRFVATHDHLTKLANRVMFQERLAQAIALSDRTGLPFAVLCFDLDRFKLVNDTRGHATGDKLLAEVANRLQQAVRATDTVARMGGDEFAIIQPYGDQPANAETLAARVLQIISAPYMIDGAPALIGVSVGIALYPADGSSSGLLLRNADMALYRAKEDGRGVYRMFEPSMEMTQQNAFQMEQDLHHALERHELSLAYQPIVDAGTREVLAYEVLLRWTHPTLGPIGPAEFVPLGEMSGSIVPIGLWTLEEACHEAAGWSDGARVSVNLSPLQFRQGDLVDQVSSVLERTGLPAARLCLEVTEGLLLDGTAIVLHTMAELQAIGVRFSLDDFGTAHAGLSYLRRFPFDAIKIDKSFVQEAVFRQEARAIVEAILAMGRALSLNVIAEGVETEEQLMLLRTMQCRQVQGFLTGAPGPAPSQLTLEHELAQDPEAGVMAVAASA